MEMTIEQYETTIRNYWIRVKKAYRDRDENFSVEFHHATRIITRGQGEIFKLRQACTEQHGRPVTCTINKRIWPDWVDPCKEWTEERRQAAGIEMAPEDYPLKKGA